LPVGGVADPARAVTVARLAIDDAHIAGANACLAHQADAESRADQALDVLTADVMADDLRTLAGRGEFRQKDVLDLRSRIALAEEEGLVLEIRPVDDVVAR